MTDANELKAVSEEGNGVKIVEHPCGIKFRYNPNNGFDAVSGLSSWGARLENFQFNDVASLKGRVAELHEFADGPIRSDRTGEIIPTHKEVYDKDTGESISVMSEGYKLLQNKALFQTFADVCDQTGLTPIGRVDVGSKGFTLGYSTFMNPEFTITLLEQYPEPIALGLEFRNSFAGQMGVSGSAWGFQAFCRNFCQWGKLMGSFWIPHDSKEIEQVQNITTEYVNSVLKNSPIITKTCSDAEGEMIDQKDVVDVLWGTNMPLTLIEGISANPEAYNKRIPEHGLTKFQLYACATNGITFRDSKAYRSTISYAEGALKILTEKTDQLIEDGKKRMKAYADQVAKQTAKREKLKAMSVPIPRTVA